MKHTIHCDLFPHAKRKALTLSYDDGTEHDRRLVEILDRYEIKGTFHLNDSRLDSDGALKSDEVASLFANHEVSAHSSNHPHLEALPMEQLAHEILGNRRALEALVSYPVRGMSYPYGTYNDAVAAALPSFGIEYSRTTQSHDATHLPGDLLRWHPTCHHKQDAIEKVSTFINAANYSQLRLFYMWGHSYEFDRENNWELIEQFAQTCAEAKDKIWFATNIEIVDYMRAMKSLKVGVNGDVASNLSHLPLWVSVDGQPSEIAPGQTVQL